MIRTAVIPAHADLLAKLLLCLKLCAFFDALEFHALKQAVKLVLSELSSKKLGDAFKHLRWGLSTHGDELFFLFLWKDICVCVNSTSGAPSLSPPADYQVMGAVFSRHLGAVINKIKDATLMSPGALGRPLALLHPTNPGMRSSTRI
jgi:hypothetical protein